MTSCLVSPYSAATAPAINLVELLVHPDHREEPALIPAGCIAMPELLTFELWNPPRGSETLELLQPLADLATPVHLTMDDLDFA